MKIFVVSGPTGSGKTDLALRLAEKRKLKLFNADPFQFYLEIPILSNQPQEGMALTGFRSLSEPMNAGAFARYAHPLLKDGQVWVGTGLYVGALLYGLDEDGRKGTPFQGSALFDYEMIVLDPPRKELYERLDRRVDEMIRQGAMDEARSIQKMIEANEVKVSNPILKAIGLKHCLQILRGEWSEAEGVRLWKRDTRRLAKRQWTWLRKFCPPSNNSCRWVDGKNFDITAAFS